jgi:hypothetical protein
MHLPAYVYLHKQIHIHKLPDPHFPLKNNILHDKVYMHLLKSYRLDQNNSLKSKDHSHIRV